MAGIESEAVGDCSLVIDQQKQIRVIDDAGPKITRAGEPESRQHVFQACGIAGDVTKLRIRETVALRDAVHQVRGVLLRVERDRDNGNAIAQLSVRCGPCQGLLTPVGIDRFADVRSTLRAEVLDTLACTRATAGRPRVL